MTIEESSSKSLSFFEKKQFVNEYFLSLCAHWKDRKHISEDGLNEIKRYFEDIDLKGIAVLELYFSKQVPKSELFDTIEIMGNINESDGDSIQSVESPQIPNRFYILLRAYHEYLPDSIYSCLLDVIIYNYYRNSLEETGRYTLQCYYIQMAIHQILSFSLPY